LYGDAAERGSPPADGTGSGAALAVGSDA
jgi:hypothetical protein